jgi:hypothetical protein
MTVRRVKTYTAQTGYVYEYYFVGSRAALDGDPFSPSTEFIFDVSPDRKSVFAVSVFLQPRALQSFAAERGRTLSDPEQYAAAKLRLLQGFDEVSNMLQDGRRLLVDSTSLITLLESVGID